MEQERIIQDIIKEWYSRNYLNAYQKIWKKIEESNNDEYITDEYWQKLSSKKFSVEYLDESEEDLFSQIEYLRKKLHLNKRNNEEIKSRIEAIRNSADVEFYARVRLILPTVVDIAVMSTINSTSWKGYGVGRYSDNGQKKSDRGSVFSHFYRSTGVS